MALALAHSTPLAACPYAKLQLPEKSRTRENRSAKHEAAAAQRPPRAEREGGGGTCDLWAGSASAISFFSFSLTVPAGGRRRRRRRRTRQASFLASPQSQSHSISGTERPRSQIAAGRPGRRGTHRIRGWSPRRSCPASPAAAAAAAAGASNSPSCTQRPGSRCDLAKQGKRRRRQRRNNTRAGKERGLTGIPK